MNKLKTKSTKSTVPKVNKEQLIRKQGLGLILFRIINKRMTFKDQI